MEEGLRVGVNLEGVLESVAEWRAGATPAGGSNGRAPDPDEKTEDEIVRQNNEALRQLQAMMPGLGI